MFLRCVRACMYVRRPWQCMVLRVTSLSDLPDRWRPLLLPTFYAILLSGPGSGASVSLRAHCCSRRVGGDALSSLGLKGRFGVLGPSHPHACIVETPLLSCLFACLPHMKPALNPRPPVQGFCPKEINPRPQCVVWSRALCSAEGFEKCGRGLLCRSSLSFKTELKLCYLESDS